LVLTIPLMILSFLAITVGWLNMPWSILKNEKFLEWVEPKIAFPPVEHPPFSNVMALISVGLVLLAIGFVVWLYQNNFAMFPGLTKRSRLARTGYTFLENKYYLDDLYENIIVYGIKKPIAAACYWFDQHVINAIVNAVGVGARRTGGWLYKNVDQTIVDG